MASQEEWYGVYVAGIQALHELSRSKYAYEAVGSVYVSLDGPLSNFTSIYTFIVTKNCQEIAPGVGAGAEECGGASGMVIYHLIWALINDLSISGHLSLPAYQQCDIKSLALRAIRKGYLRPQGSAPQAAKY
jgi:hypothetical protein